MAWRLYESIRAAAESSILSDHAGQPVRFTVSIGVASMGSDESLADAMRRADDRLYEAKKISRNCVVGV